MKRAGLHLALIIALGLCARGRALTIVPSFDTSITSLRRAGEVEATINSAIALYEHRFSNPVTVRIAFHGKTTNYNILGQNNGYTLVSLFPYRDYRQALERRAQTADDEIALAHLPNTVTNPVNGNEFAALTPALAQALGFVPANGTDAAIDLDISSMNITSAERNPANYSLFSIACHEIDEVLGLGSALNYRKNGSPPPTGAVWPEDLFRYDDKGRRSFTTAPTAAAYLSLNGTTDMVRLNQNDGGDFGDWYSPNGMLPAGVPVRVQDAFCTPGTDPAPGLELSILEVIGWNYKGSRYVKADDSGPQYSAAPTSIRSMGFSAKDSFSISFSARAGSTYIIETSSNLLAWTPIWTNAAASTNFWFEDPRNTRSDGRFYRIRKE